MVSLFGKFKSLIPFVPNIGFAISGVQALRGQSKKARATLKKATKGAIAIGAVAIGGGTAFGRSALVSIGKALIPKTVKGKVLATGGAIIAAGAIARKPKEVGRAATKAPPKVIRELTQFGGGLAEFISDPSLTSAKQLIKESPLLVAGTGLILGGAALRIAAPIVGGALARGRGQTTIITESAPPQLVAPVPAPVKQAAAAAPTSPVTPETKTQARTPTTKRKKRRTAKKKPSMTQRVNIVIQNRTTGTRVNNKFIKEQCFN